MSWIAAGLAALIFAMHTFVAGPRVLNPILASDRDVSARALLEVLWHLVTVTLAVIAALLFDGRLAWLAGLFCAAFAVVFVLVGERNYGAPIRLPQWILLGPIAIYTLAPGAAVPILLGAIALVHVAWGLGSSWPARDREGLALAIIGRRVHPSTLACLVVAAALAAAALTLGGSPPAWLRIAIAGIFLVRGTVGFIERWLRREIRGTPYEVLSGVMYTPLSLSIGAAILV